MPYRKTPATAARKEARRKTLLDAAARLFGLYGYHAATVPMIVGEAGSSVGSFYLYFRNKEDIFAAVLEAFGAKLAEVMHEAQDCAADPVDGITRAVETLFMLLADNPQESRILIVESSGLSPRLEKVRRGLLSEHIGHVRDTIVSAPEVFSVRDPAIASRCLVGAVFEALTGWLAENPATRRPAAEVAHDVAEYNTRAICR